MLLTNVFTKEQRGQIRSALAARDISEFSRVAWAIKASLGPNSRTNGQIETAIPGILYTGYLLTTQSIDRQKLEELWSSWNTQASIANNGINEIKRNCYDGSKLKQVLDRIVLAAS